MEAEKKETIVEKEITRTNGGIVLAALIMGTLLGIAGIIAGGVMSNAYIIIASVLLFLVSAVMYPGLKVVHPNEAIVYTFFGKYYGTIKQAGFYFINPFAEAYNPSAGSWITELASTVEASARNPEKAVSGEAQAARHNKKISTKTLTLDNKKQKVNDALGNPVVIGAVAIWKVVNPTKAVFNVENYNTYLSIQCDTIIRNNARLYPYDTMEEGTDEKTLRGSSQEIADKMKSELQERVAEAGIEIKEVRITHLAYAEEIAAAMLQKQQAVAVIAARQKIVEGAVGMVRMAVEQLGEEAVVTLDEERKAAMVSNLMVVLCGNKDAQPIINSGSIY